MEKYMAWHQDRSNQAKHHTACEGFGMTLRLVDSSSGILQELLAFLESEQWNQTLANKFGLVLSDTYTANGIQKYLDGYEISPHPDIRRKALTFMVNVNAHPESESWAHHTHYLKLKPEFSYVQSFWESNEDCDRCWLPWHWCETVSMQSKNNSAVIFSPSNDTLHGVKASYDHLVAQRTQLYGNLWYRDVPDLDVVEWEAFDVRNHSANQLPLSHRIFRILPKALRNALKQIVLPDSKNVIRDRKKF